MKRNFKRKILKNGMTILFEERNLPVVSVSIGVRAGGINELLKEKGITHFFEHMLYKGTSKRNFLKIMTDIEKNGGEINGFTSEEIVAFWCKMPSSKLNLALDVLQDLVRNPLFDEKELEKERKVIFEEIKMRKDNPFTYVMDELQKTLYSGTLSVDVIGKSETINKISRERLVKFHNQICSPKNLVLSVVGKANFKDLVNFGKTYFKGKNFNIPGGRFGLKNEIKINEREGIDQAHLAFGYHVPVSSNAGSNAAIVLSALMAEGGSSRLFQELREKRNLAYSIKGGSNINKNFAYNLVYIGTSKEETPLLKKLILNEFEKVAKDLTENELNQVKNQLIGQHKISMEDSQVQMVNLLASEIQGDARKFYNFEKEIKKVNLKDVKRMASMVKKGKYSFFALVPKKK